MILKSLIKQLSIGIALGGAAILSTSAFAACPVSYATLKSALQSAVAAEVSGLNFDVWGTVVDRDGIVCAVAFTGADRGAQWPGGRVESAQKANSANAFSLNGLSLSTANLYSAVQPGGQFFDLQETNPVNTDLAYAGKPDDYGTAKDPMVSQKIGGVNPLGGGIALYGAGHVAVGAVGVSGDTSCADHNIAWRTRNNLALDHVPGCVSGDNQRPDNIVFDITSGISVSGFGHPLCTNTDVTGTAALPPVSPQ